MKTNIRSKFMKTVATLIAPILVGTGTLAVAGCGGETDDIQLNVVKGLPDYSADEATKTLMIGGYVAPYRAGIANGNPNHITVEQYQMIKEAGLDYILTLYEQGPSNPDIALHLQCAKEAGVKVMVRWDEVMSMGNASPELLRNLLSPILEEEAFMGIFASDEPTLQEIKILAKASEVYSQVTDKYFYVNLFPNYANLSQLGANSYREYVNTYCALVKSTMVNEDHYPFGHVEGSTKYTMSDGFLSNLELVQKYADYYGKEHWAYIQGMRFSASSKTPDYYDYRLQSYVNMCYGVVNMQYFCYMSHMDYSATPSYEALVTCQGVPTERYDHAKKINAEVHAFDHVYLNYAENFKGAMTIVGSENERGRNNGFDSCQYSIESTDRIKSIQATQDTLVGTYKDNDGRDGFMIVNYSIPGYRLKDTVEIQFREADALLYYQEGVQKLVDLKDGKFSIELDAGEGIFAIPVKY